MNRVNSNPYKLYKSFVGKNVLMTLTHGHHVLMKNNNSVLKMNVALRDVTYKTIYRYVLLKKTSLFLLRHNIAIVSVPMKSTTSRVH